MSDKELLDILDKGGQVSVPYFDGATVSVSECEIPLADALQPFKNFLALSDEQRQSDGRHLLAYCKMMMEVVGEEEILEDMGGVAPNQESIWNHATVKHIFFGHLDAGKYAAKPNVYVQIEGEVAWEPEHGLQMSWANGSQLVKAGAFDGHPTNGHALADPTQDKYVFSCYSEDLRTLPDPL